MTNKAEEIRHILEMIKAGGDNGNAREINKAVSKLAGWYYYTPSEAKKRFKRTYKRGAWIAPEDCRDGEPVFCQLHGTEVHRDC